MLKQHLILPGLALFMMTAMSTATEISASDGEQNYLRFCAACHGEGARGDGPVATSIFRGVPDLTRIAARNNGEFPREMVGNTIDGRFRIEAHGTKTMPVWGYEFWVTENAGNFSDENVDAIVHGLVDYLQSIQVDSDTSE